MCKFFEPNLGDIVKLKGQELRFLILETLISNESEQTYYRCHQVGEFGGTGANGFFEYYLPQHAIEPIQ